MRLSGALDAVRMMRKMSRRDFSRSFSTYLNGRIGFPWIVEERFGVSFPGLQCVKGTSRVSKSVKAAQKAPSATRHRLHSENGLPRP